MENNPLIYGKNTTENIVSIEIGGDSATLFIRKDGQLSELKVPHRYWALFPKQETGAIRMAGDLYYKWGRQFTDKRVFDEFIAKLGDKFVIYNEKEALMVKDGFCYYKGMNHKQLNIMGIDIEATGLVHDKTSKVLLVAVTNRINGVITRKLFAYDDYNNPKEMFLALNKYVRDSDPDIILAHNGYGYDFPYLKYVASRYGVGLAWGRDGSDITISSRYSKYRVDGSRDLMYQKIKVYGREIVDTMFLAYKHDAASKKYESYGLKNIIKVEKLEEKDRVHYDAASIRYNYTKPVEWEKIKRYCEHDADDLIKLFDLMVPPFFYMANFIPKPFQTIMESASGSQLNAMMVRSYLQDGHSIPKADPIEPYAGAISFGVSGIWNNCYKLDVASLYPSIMLNYKLYDKRKDPKAHLYQIVSVLRDQRLYHKKRAKIDPYHDYMQGALKILINSLYGFLGATGLNFNYLEGADFVTRTGREILKHAIFWASGKVHDERSELDSTEEDA